MNKKLTMLTILDGFGINDNEKGNAVKLANTPFIDKLMKQNPTTTIKTSGLDVGLPERTNGKFRSRTYKYRSSEELFIKN
jgi:2,3-bisphosphoglycerate-independent phosphoglycerate mutase